MGSPERPLSALGALAYKQYWTHAIKLFLHTASEPVRLEGKPNSRVLCSVCALCRIYAYTCQISVVLHP